MKKQVNKLTLKTDQIIALSKADAANVNGGAIPLTQHTACKTALGCPSKYVC
ncbi:class I lanthipeptide [Spirosoma gilvum]